MKNCRRIDSLLRNQDFTLSQSIEDAVYNYAGGIADIENAVVVVSDLKNGRSKIFCGGFANVIGINGYNTENSIWEKEIFKLMEEKELEEKYLSEIRFFNFIRQLTKSKRSRYCLLSRLRFRSNDRKYIDVAHRMYYKYDDNGAVRYGICVYSPASIDMKSQCLILDQLTGETLEMCKASDMSILSRREIQVLQLIERGLSSKDISVELNISRYTVSRHRQEILAKLQVRNSAEACRIAHQLGII